MPLLLLPEILPRRHAYAYPPDLSRPYIGNPTRTHIYPETGLNRGRRIYPGNRLVSRACRRCIIYKTALNCLCRNGDGDGDGGGFWFATPASSRDIYEHRLEDGEGEFGGGAPREDILARLKAWRNDLQAKPSYSSLAEPRRGRGFGVRGSGFGVRGGRRAVRRK